MFTSQPALHSSYMLMAKGDGCHSVLGSRTLYDHTPTCKVKDEFGNQNVVLDLESCFLFSIETTGEDQ